MRFTYGCTRWVILTDKYAIKIARIRPLRPFVRLFIGVKEENVGKVLKQRYKRNFLFSGLKYIFYILFGGFVANYIEYKIYKNNPNKYNLVPTIFTFFFIFNIQIKGEPLKKSADIKKHRLWSFVKFLPKETDLFLPKQFCLINNKPYLADYGSPDAKFIFENLRKK